MKRLPFAAGLLAVAMLGAAGARAQVAVPGDPFPNDPRGIVNDPCPQHSDAETRDVDKNVLALRGLTRDFAGICAYREDDVRLVAAKAHPRIVFMGDSITWLWKHTDPAFFPEGEVIGRGIGGQTTAQMLGRFRNDVLDLQPQAVHILAGTNDVAGNTGAATIETVEGNIASMAELARAHGIKVVLGSVPPAAAFPWSKTIPNPAATIEALDAWLRAYAARNGFTYVDYRTAMAGPDGGMKPGLSLDGVHPSPAGYAVMEPLAKAAIAKALGGQ